MKYMAKNMDEKNKQKIERDIYIYIYQLQK